MGQRDCVWETVVDGLAIALHSPNANEITACIGTVLAVGMRGAWK